MPDAEKPIKCNAKHRQMKKSIRRRGGGTRRKGLSEFIDKVIDQNKTIFKILDER